MLASLHAHNLSNQFFSFLVLKVVYLREVWCNKGSHSWRRLLCSDVSYSKCIL